MYSRGGLGHMPVLTWCAKGLAWANMLSVFAMYMLMIYLTDVWNLSTKDAANIINIFDGVNLALIVVFAFLVDNYLGSFTMSFISSIAHSIGLLLMTLSTPPFFSRCRKYMEECMGHEQKVLFFTSLPIIIVGIVGHRISLHPISPIQRQGRPDVEGNPRGTETMGSLMITVLVIIFGGVVLSYIQPWSYRFGIPAICSLTATVFNLVQSSSPLYTTDAMNPDQPKLNSKMLSLGNTCTTHEEIHIVPFVLTFIVTGVVLSLGNTYFLDQANHMDRTLGPIQIHITMFLCLTAISKFASTFIYVCLEMCFPRKYFAVFGNAIGLVFSISCCITSAVVETKRQKVIQNNGTTRMHILYLFPQYVFLGVVDGFQDCAMINFLRDHVPPSLHTYLLHFQKFLLGLGNLAAVILVYVLGKVSEINNNQNWFQHTSNESRLDLYYWTLAGLSTINLVIYVIVASLYKFKERPLDEDHHCLPDNIKEKNSLDEDQGKQSPLVEDKGKSVG